MENRNKSNEREETGEQKKKQDKSRTSSESGRRDQSDYGNKTRKSS